MSAPEVIVKSVPSPSIFSDAPPNTIPTSLGMCTSEVAVRLILAPEVIVKSVLSPSIFSPLPKVTPTLAGITTSATAVRLMLLPAIVKSVPSPSIFSPSLPKVKPTLTGRLTSSAAARSISPPESSVTVVPASSAVPSAVIWILAAAAALSVVSIESVPFVPTVNTAVSSEEPVMVITLPSTPTSSTVREPPVIKPVVVRSPPITTSPLNVALPASAMSISNAVIALESSVPLILKFLSAVLTVSSTSEELFAMSSIDVPSSLIVTLAPPASSIISPDESSVMSVPSLVIVSSAMLPMLVMFASLISNEPVTSKLPPTDKLPDTSTAPSILISVAVRCISAPATRSR